MPHLAGMGIRAELHALIDALSDDAIAELHGFVKARQMLDELSESERAQLQASLERGEREIASGKGLSPDAARSLLRS